tara:strand:- start:243 stop:521 length:279 start_codon:yes stop_codon:yes gene_type:complete
MIKTKNSLIDKNSPTYFIAEIGINHNGDINNAFKLIEASKLAGCNAVKFQKRFPKLCVPRDQWDIKKKHLGEKCHILITKNEWNFQKMIIVK